MTLDTHNDPAKDQETAATNRGDSSGTDETTYADFDSYANDIARQLFQGAAMFPDDPEADTGEIDPDNAAKDDVILDNPLVSFAFKVNPKYSQSFDPNDSYTSYRHIQIAQAAKEIRDLVSDLKRLQLEQERDSLAPAKSSGHQSANDIAKEDKKDSQQSEKQQSSRGDTDSTTKPSSLELKLESLTLQLNESKEREKDTNSSPVVSIDTSKEYEAIRLSIFELLERFRIITGSQIVYNTATSGVLIFSEGEVLLEYDKHFDTTLSDLLTKDEHEKFIELQPTNYFDDVRRIFNNTPLRSYPVDEKVYDNFDDTYSAWKSSDVVATLEITPNVAPVQGSALFRSKLPKDQLLAQAYSHFDDKEQVRINIISDNGPQATSGANDEQESEVVLLYTFTGSGPRRQAPSSAGFSEFIVLSQTKPMRLWWSTLM